jgi:hypothetical protein
VARSDRGWGAASQKRGKIATSPRKCSNTGRDVDWLRDTLAHGSRTMLVMNRNQFWKHGAI